MGDETTRTSSIELGEQSKFEKLLSGVEFSKANQDRLSELQDQSTRHTDLTRQLEAVGDSSTAGPQRTTLQTQLNALQFDPAELADLEKQKTQSEDSIGSIQRVFQELEGLVQSGAGEGDVTRSVEAQRALAAAFGLASETGLKPTERDIQFGTESAQDLFAEERLRLGQAFTTQQEDTASLAASLGRATDDPILQAKLRTGFIREQAAQQARQQGFARGLALEQPGQRLDLQQRQVGVLGGLASQAFQNRSAILGLGQALQADERNFRLAQGTTTQTTQESPGALSIIGGIAGGVGSLFSGGGAIASSGGLLNLGKNFLQGTPKGT